MHVGNAECEAENRVVCTLVCADVANMTEELVDVCGCETDVSTIEETPQLLFVHPAASATLEGDTLTLHGIGEVVWFTDRPLREAGVWSANEYLNLFSSPVANSTDTDSFSEDPPNAAMICTASDGSAVNMIVELTAPELLSSDTLSYTVSVLDGPAASTMLECSGVQLFVDGGSGCTCGDYRKSIFNGKSCCVCIAPGSPRADDFANPTGVCNNDPVCVTVDGQLICDPQSVECVT